MSSEENLVRQAIDGNQSAFTQLYDEHFDKVYRYIYFRVSNRDEAEDLTQEVFIKALRGIGSYKWRDVHFTSWLFRIAHNQVIDYIRKQAKEKRATLDEAATVVGDGDPVVMTEQKSEIEELTKALKKLPAAQQEVISLRFIAGMPIAEVAKTLGKSEGTVKALQFNGTASLRKYYSGAENV